MTGCSSAVSASPLESSGVSHPAANSQTEEKQSVGGA